MNEFLFWNARTHSSFGDMDDILKYSTLLADTAENGLVKVAPLSSAASCSASTQKKLWNMSRTRERWAKISEREEAG